MRLIYWIVYLLTIRKPCTIKLKKAKQHDLVWDGTKKKFVSAPYDHDRKLWVLKPKKSRLYKLHNWAWYKLVKMGHDV